MIIVTHFSSGDLSRNRELINQVLLNLLFVVKLSILSFPALASVLLLLTAEMSVSLLFLVMWWALLLFTAGAAFVSC